SPMPRYHPISPVSTVDEPARRGIGATAYPRGAAASCPSNARAEAVVSPRGRRERSYPPGKDAILMSAHPVPALTPEQMARVDRIMGDELGVATLQLMELGGQAVAWWARQRFLTGDARGKSVLILAGSGGNGGDGMVAARLLHAWGARPEVWLSHEIG